MSRIDRNIVAKNARAPPPMSRFKCQSHFPSPIIGARAEDQNVDPSDDRSRRREVVGANGFRREAGARSRGSVVTRARQASVAVPTGQRRGRVGVVKSRRARGGCLGVAGKLGVAGCEKLGGGAERPSIPRYPDATRGTETSQYPEERKATATPSVAASERGSA